MRRLAVLIMLAWCTLPVMRVPAAPPTLGAVNTISGVGSVAMDVTLPEGAAIGARQDPPRSPGWADITTTGRFAAIALVSKSATFNGGASIVYAFEYHMVAPSGCSADAAPAFPRRCLDPYNQPFYNVASVTSYDAETNTTWFTYPAGDYRLYLLTEPDATATATFAVKGASGSLTATASEPAHADASLTQRDDPALAFIDARSEHTVVSRGLAWMGFWDVGADPDQSYPVPFTYHECLTAGEPGPASPFECVPMYFAPSVEAGGTPLATHSTTWQLGTGPSLDAEGTAALASPVLAPGRYVNTASIARGGIGPGVGVWTVWLEI